MCNYTVYMHISPSGKRYIGITCLNPKHRWNKGKGYKNNKYFINAIEKYGWDNFKHIIIAKDLNEEIAKWLEMELIKEWGATDSKKGYNITLGGEGTTGWNPSEETRKKMSESLKKRLKDKENHPMYGKNPRDYMTEEAKKEHDRKISEANSGENHPNYGKILPDETKKKISETKKGKNTGKNHPRAKTIICITTFRIFYTATEGAEYYGCQRTNINMVCKGKRKYTGKLSDGTKLVWRYIEIIEL